MQTASGDELTEEDIEQYLQYFLIIIAAIMMLMACFGWIDSKKIHDNELFEWKPIMIFLFYACDFISDLFFSGKLLLLSGNMYYFVLFIASIFFILIPVVFNIYQLHQEISEWNRDSETDRKSLSSLQVSRWIKTRIKMVYMLSFVSGSSFSAIALLNCYLFSLDMFSMGLSKQQSASFQNKRIFSVVLLEVKLAYNLCHISIHIARVDVYIICFFGFVYRIFLS